MTDSSYKNNCLTESYNEQEWIGDRVLGFEMAKFVSLNCQDTVDAKSATFATLTSNEFWAVLTVRHGIHKHIKLCDNNLTAKIDAFAEQQTRNGHQHMHEFFEIVESVDDPELPFATFTEPPKELADV
ncbi:endoribonuclease Dcr-1-like [Daphnia pulicaria]|uniref:endoribonuclease Dcr-1-like n=1 Tax=Daphnia pulicaria TaxID=35523 RepID=UPI001EEBE7BC|nr:endoribonuclease Dcr-1-like [Daphnia pulicaria]